MRIFIKVKAGSKENKVEKIDDSHYTIKVKALAKENKANFAVIEALAEYFKTSISNIKLVSGRTSKEKVFEIQ